MRFTDIGYKDITAFLHLTSVAEKNSWERSLTVNTSQIFLHHIINKTSLTSAHRLNKYSVSLLEDLQVCILAICTPLFNSEKSWLKIWEFQRVEPVANHCFYVIFQCYTDENILHVYSLQKLSFLVIFPQPGPSGRDALIFRVLQNTK